MNTSIKEIKLISPFDAHMHWRQASTLLHKVAKYSMNQFAGGLLMPNTDPKILSMEQLRWYRKEITSVVLDPLDIDISFPKFLPIFTFYLSPELPIQDLLKAWSNHLINGVKYYPKGGTTNSEKGMNGFKEVGHILKVMEENHIPLLIHPETARVGDSVIIDNQRENQFLSYEFIGLPEKYPNLRIVLEHITTEEAVNYTLGFPNVVATITPQHCLFDDRALFNGTTFDSDGVLIYDENQNGMNPKLMCRPILKPTNHVHAIQNALKKQAKEGLKKFGLGTDTAPHTSDKKYCECGACGVFSAPIALEMYAIAFEQMGILDHLPTFACDIMPDFYDIKKELPYKEVVLQKRGYQVEKSYEGIVTPFAGQIIPWSMRTLV